MFLGSQISISCPEPGFSLSLLWLTDLQSSSGQNLERRFHNQLELSGLPGRDPTVRRASPSRPWVLMLGAMRPTGFVMSTKVKSGKMEEYTNMPNVNETGEHPKRRAVTAESMAAKQRDISVSEFFAKNRHLLGFDNPRKALLTAVKEAVDNSLDACEEAGIVPEVWVHIEATGPNRYKIGVQDNGPGIVKKQIPLIFGKLLYGSKFHRLRMSRGQQGIGISAAGMYGMLTTGKPVKIVSMTSPKKPAHYFEIQIDTRRNMPEIINGKGDGEDIPASEKGHKYITDRGIEWVSHYPVPDQQYFPVW
jgi:hypothetical protein